MCGEKYKITLDESQVATIASALDLYYRMFCGQVKELSNVLLREKHFDVTKVDELLNEVKAQIFPELKGASYYGIYQTNTSKESKDGYDLYKQLQHLLCKNSKHWSVNKDPHTLFASEQIPLEIEVITHVRTI